MQLNHLEQKAPQEWTLQALFTVAFLGLAAGVLMADMGLQSISLSAIQKTFSINDAKLGALQGLAGVLVGAALAVPLARLSDIFSRKALLLCLIVVSAGMMVLSALAPSFELFFIGRSASSIAEFAMIPLVYSMIPDLSPERHRVLANLSFAAIMASGASAGFYFAADIVGAGSTLFDFVDIESWRKGFLFLSLVCVPVFLLGFLTQNPPRRVIETEEDTAETSFLLFISSRWKTIVLFICMAGFLMVAVQALNQLTTLALERRFNADPKDIGPALGTILLITSLSCLPFAGLLDRVIGKFVGNAVRPMIMAIAAMIALPTLFLLTTSTESIDRAFILLAVFGFVTSTANALVPTMLQDLAPAPLRARIFAIWSFIVSLFIATGPMIAGALSDSIFDGRLLTAISVTSIPALVISAFSAGFLFILLRKKS
ncbi:MFS transporter [Sphingobacterium corticis]|uniref:MFS transporter n=1 Tax=Sphingobacterium corticis TaxID=1812823 RepID=A0ABW5NHS2_9SPHI